MSNNKCIEVVMDKDAAGTYHPIEPEDVVDSKNDKYTLHSNPSFNLNISNMTNPDTTSSHSGIGMLFADGELQPVWNGQKYLSVSLSEKEFLKTISTETSYHSGEKHDMCMLYAELENSQNSDCEPFSYAEISYCTIENLSSQDIRTSFQPILSMTALPKLEIRQYSCVLSSCPQQNLLENTHANLMKTGSEE